jgi:hypothetical protein
VRGIGMTLKEYFPYIMDSAFDNDRVRRYADIEIINKHDAFYKRWIGKHKNVHFWVELSNGYAVGMNESPTFGLGFLIVKIE